MRPRPALPALVLSALVLLSPPLRGEEPPPPPPGPDWVTPQTRERWSASGEFAAGTSLWGPVSSIQDAMFEAGFDDPGSGGFLGSETVSYPRIHDYPDRVSYWVGFRQGRRGRPWSFGLGAGLTGLGTAEGHRAGPYGGDGVFVTVKSSVFTFAPMVWLQAAPVLRLGLGPAVHAVDLDPGVSDVSDVDPPEGENPIWRAGLLVEAAITFPAESTVYFTLLGQYRWLAEATLDPREAGFSLAGPVEVPLSHAFVAIGFGFRF